MWVETAPALEGALEEWRQAPAIAVDTEANSFFAYRERTCLVQVSTRESDAIVDPLTVDLSPMASLFGDENVEKVFHASEGDLQLLKRDYGFEFRNVFDTLVAAKAAGRRKLGLASLVEELVGVKLAKDEQRSDWGRRPLTPQQIEYAFSDTAHLLEVSDLLKAEVLARGPDVVEEVAVDCARLAQRPVRPREPDPDAFERHPLARTLDPVGRQILRCLYLAREARAQETDKPPFRIVSDQSLGEIATRRPQSKAEMGKIPGVTPAVMGRHGAALMAAVAEALEKGPLPRQRRKGTIPDPAEEERFEALRDWRRSRAETRGVEVDVIAGNAALKALAKANPTTPEQLAQVPELDEYRARRYGEDLLAALRKGRARR